MEPYLNYLLLHSTLAQFAIYWAGVLTCLAGIGCIIPSIVLFTMLGTLIGLEKLPFISTILCASSGASTGSLFSFWLGYYYRDKLRQTWLLRSYPQLLLQSEAFFKRFGEISIFIGRFLGPIRAILPLIAGMTGMRTQYFLIADITSGFLWPATYIIPSIYLVHSLSDIVAALPIYQLIYTAIGLVIMYFMFKWLQPYYEYPTLQAKRWLFATLVEPIRSNQLLTHTLLYTPLKKKVAYPLLTVLSFSAAILAYLIFDVLSKGTMSQWNIPIYHYIDHFRSAFANQAWIMVTLFNAFVIYLFWFNIFISLVLQKEYWRALHWGGLGLLSLLTTESLKITLSIPRPLGINQLLDSNSFPSGHVTLNATLLGGFLSLLHLQVGIQKGIRQLVYGLYGIGITLIAFSRLYLYAHWFTDIIGALLVSVINLVLFHLSYHRHILPLKGRAKLIRTGLMSLVCGWGLHFIMRYQIMLTYYISL